LRPWGAPAAALAAAGAHGYKRRAHSVSAGIPMRAETEATVQQIKQSLELLRRHL